MSDYIKINAKGFLKLCADGLAHSITTCVIELIQNAIDAGAKNINVTTTPKAFIVSDDGTGMNREQLESMIMPAEDRPREKKKIGLYGIGFLCAAAKLCDYSKRHKDKNEVTVVVQSVSKTDWERDEKGNILEFDVKEVQGSYHVAGIPYTSVTNAGVKSKVCWGRIRRKVEMPVDQGTTVVIANGHATSLNNYADVCDQLDKTQSRRKEMNKDEIEHKDNLRQIFRCVMHSGARVTLNGIVLEDSEANGNLFKNPFLDAPQWLRMQISAVYVPAEKKRQVHMIKNKRGVRGKGGKTQVIFRYVDSFGSYDYKTLFPKRGPNDWVTISQNGISHPAIKTTYHCDEAYIDVALVNPRYHTFQNGMLYLEQCKMGTMQHSMMDNSTDKLKWCNARLMWETPTCSKVFFGIGNAGANKSLNIPLSEAFFNSLKLALIGINSGSSLWNIKINKLVDVIDRDEVDEASSNEEDESNNSSEEADEQDGPQINALMIAPPVVGGGALPPAPKSAPAKKTAAKAVPAKKPATKKAVPTKAAPKGPEQAPPKTKAVAKKAAVAAAPKRMEFTDAQINTIVQSQKCRSKISGFELDLNYKNGGLFGMPWDIDHINSPSSNAIDNGQALDCLSHAIKTRDAARYAKYEEECEDDPTNTSRSAIASFVRSLMGSPGFQHALTKVTADGEDKEFVFTVLNNVVTHANLPAVKWITEEQ